MGQTPSAPSPTSPPSGLSSAIPQAPHPLPPNASSSDASACPVSPQSREAWLRAATQHQQFTSTSSTSTPPAQPAQPLAPHPLPPGADAFSATECPVSPESREAWLRAAQRQPPGEAVRNGEVPATAAPLRPKLTNHRLSTHREVSSIPRGYLSTAGAATPTTPPSTDTNTNASSPSPTPIPPPPPSPYATTRPPIAHGTPANSESSTTDIHTSPTGHWVYPSELQFFNAMRRKNYNPQAPDMTSIIPIHNAVNERTWHEVLRWERGRGAEKCGGPKLVSFEGDASKLTPRAWWLSSVWGYQRPFDRHDWVVDRCGTRVEYVIDFYEGKKGRRGEDRGGPSFYLDVRPKLNSVEGVKMRVQSFWGLG